MVKRVNYTNYRRNPKKWGEKGCKVFISGPMSGYPDFNRSSFYLAEDILKQYGAAVFNPAWMLFDCDYWTHEQILDIDLCALDKCDAILHLPGWERSDGAFEEACIAKELHLKELYLDTDDQDRLIIIEHGELINNIRERLRAEKDKEALEGLERFMSSDMMIKHGTDDESN